MAVRYGMPWNGAEVAREAEQHGFAAFTSGEFVDVEAYSTLTEMVVATTNSLVGPGIAYAFARTPYAHAAAIRQLHKQAPGRLFLGLGSGAFTINRDWFGVPADRPVARISDLVGAVKAWLHAENGARVTYEGEFYSVNAVVQAPVLGRLDVPVLLAGFNAGMARAAGRVADGIIGHGLFTQRWWDEVVRPAVAQGAGTERAIAEHGWIITAIDDEDPERARQDARKMIGFYLTVKTYDPFVELHGWTKEVEQIRAAFREGNMDAMARAVSDQMLSEIAVCGSTDEALQTMRTRKGSFAKDVSYFAPPSFLVSPRRRQAYARASFALVGSA